jgi:hypothetical protein
VSRNHYEECNYRTKVLRSMYDKDYSQYNGRRRCDIHLQKKETILLFNLRTKDIQERLEAKLRISVLK